MAETVNNLLTGQCPLIMGYGHREARGILTALQLKSSVLLLKSCSIRGRSRPSPTADAQLRYFIDSLRAGQASDLQNIVLY